MKKYITILILFCSLGLTAQTTSIPDQNFEQILIDEGIDSDGVVNGQVLTSDISSVTTLDLQTVNDLTGLQNFGFLEELILGDSGPTNNSITLDLTANMSLIKLEVLSFYGLENLDLSGLTNLEELLIMELQEDVQTMNIEEIDLSTNLNIQKVEVNMVFGLEKINLRNGNNQNMSNFLLSALYFNLNGNYDIPLCVKVDDEAMAAANTEPYDTWNITGIDPTFYESGECVLAVNQVTQLKATLYPNPTQNNFQIHTSEKIDEVHVFSITGKHLAKFRSQESYDISHFPTGVYFVKIKAASGERIQKLIKR